MVNFGREIYTRELPSVDDPFEEINGSHVIEDTCLYVSLSSKFYHWRQWGPPRVVEATLYVFKSMDLGQIEEINRRQHTATELLK